MSVPLPLVALPEGEIIEGPLAGTKYHSLSRSQAMKVHSYQGREDEAEDFILACGTDRTVEEAHKWRDSVSLEVAGQLVDAIIIISGLTPDGPAEGV